MSVPFRIDTNPTGRNTRAAIVDTCDHEGRPLRLYVSYDTVIAVRGCNDDGSPDCVRRSNEWGPTTGRHFADLGCRDFPMVADFPAYVRMHFGLDVK